MKTRCLQCGENHRTGACEIKEKIENPLCINCNTRGHMASSTTCPQFPKPKKGKAKSPIENLKRNISLATRLSPESATRKFLIPIRSNRWQHPGIPPRRQIKPKIIKMSKLILRHLMPLNLKLVSLAFFKPYSKNPKDFHSLSLTSK
ncbi:hypothetical protein TNCV_126921 [Trichonephila clavipes]|nr:hypothetical protein TNCV_126921 [Trichonephila clavipes]